MKYDKRSEYGAPPEEYHIPPEQQLPASEHSAPDEQYSKAREYPAPETVTGAERESGSKLRDRLKKMLFMPIAAAVATVSVTFAAFNYDVLGGVTDDIYGREYWEDYSRGPVDVQYTDPDDGVVEYYYHVIYNTTGEQYSPELPDEEGRTDMESWIEEHCGDSWVLHLYDTTLTYIGWRSSDDAIIVGDPDNMESAYIAQGEVYKLYRRDLYYEVYDSNGGESSGDEDQGERADDSFPYLSNLEPNSYITSAPYHSKMYGSEIKGVLNEEFIHLYALDGSGVYIMQNDGSGNEQFNESIEGISYNPLTNTLTLDNFHGDVLAFNLMGNGFKIKLVGDNTLQQITGWGFYVGGSVTFTGDGTLVINGDKNFAMGIQLDCEWSETCLMIDGTVKRLEVFGKPERGVEIGGGGEYRDAHGAIFISDTTMEKAIYYLAPLKLTGGTRAAGIFGPDAYGNYADSYDFGSYHDYTVADEDGNPSMHVVFERAD